MPLDNLGGRGPLEAQPAPLSDDSLPTSAALFSDRAVADLLLMTVPWVRAHAREIPGYIQLGCYYRFRPTALAEWLGSLEPLISVPQAAKLLGVPTSWVYANAEQIPGVARLGRYVRFRPAVFHRFLAGSEVAQ